MDKRSYYIWLSELQHGNNIEEKEAEKILSMSLALGMEVITIESESYPNALRQIHEPPFVLYCYGDVSLLKKAEVAVVGTRRPSAYGRWMTQRIGEVIARHGAVHVSGMAEGIDAEGHRTVLRCGGKSIAVLGTGADLVYPSSSQDIYDRLKISGLVVSEYKPGTPGSRSTFPERNRIVSGISQKCIVVEGALRSGSLITSRLALEQGKDIYAVPGNVDQPTAIVPNQLIMDGATPLISIKDLEETIFNGF